MRPLFLALTTIPIRLQRLGILLAGEFLAVGHAHHIREDLEAIAIRIEEIERAATAATEIASALEAMDEWTTNRFHPFGVQMGQGLEKGIAVLDLEGDLLDQPLAGAGSGHVHAWGGGADDEVVVHIVKA